MRSVPGLFVALTLASAACSGSQPAASLDGASGVDGNGASDGSSGGGVDTGSAAPDAGATTGGDGAALGDGSSTGGDASTIVDSCNPLTQMGCAAPATKCIVESTQPMGGANCVQPSPNDVGLGAMCTGGDCAPMLACVQTSTASSTCVHLCDIDNGGAGCDSLGNDFDCRSRIRGTNWGFCIRLGEICDPVTQAPCPLDQACAPILRTTGQYEFRCKPQGTQGDGQSCGSGGGGDCLRGFVCVRNGISGAAICRKFCAMDPDCPSPQMCTGTVTMPPFHFCTPM
jgi:hypothetical protein